MNYKLVLIYYLVAVFLSIFATQAWIFICRKRGWGQEIRKEGNQAHYYKEGTPTMAGVAMALAFTLLSLIGLGLEAHADPSAHGFHADMFIILLACLGYACVGFIDDRQKIHKHESEGLTPREKLVLQFILAILLVFILYLDNPNAGIQTLPISGRIVHMGFWAAPLMVFVIVGTVNAVNLTDGLDGLAAGVSLPVFLTIGLLAGLYPNAAGLYPAYDVAMTAFIFAGIMTGYLFFNAHPCSVMMGDTGSMAVGGAICGMLLVLNRLPLLLVLGGVYLAEALSVIIQTTYFKHSGGKRVFLMAPLHHHFELKGKAEEKVAAAFSLVSLIFSILTLTLAHA